MSYSGQEMEVATLKDPLIIFGQIYESVVTVTDKSLNSHKYIVRYLCECFMPTGSCFISFAEIWRKNESFGTGDATNENEIDSVFFFFKELNEILRNGVFGEE